MNKKNKYYSFFSFILLLFTFQGQAQVGGKQIFTFLKLPVSARAAAMGGNAIIAKDDDISQATANPSLLNPLMNKQFSLQHNFYLSDIQNGTVSYGHYLDRFNSTFSLGVQYINYGKFEGFDEFEQSQGQFTAAEYAFLLGAGKQLSEHLSVGSTLKFISSQLETYQATGLGLDVAATYTDSSSRFLATFVCKNMGKTLSNYSINANDKIPFEVQLGISKRLKHLPFRFGIVLQQLQRWNLMYYNPINEEGGFVLLNEENAEQTTSPFVTFIDNFSRHIILNGEFFLGKSENLKLRFGYNRYINRELSVINFRSFAGFGVGFGFNIKRFHFDFGKGLYHLAGGTTYIGMGINFSKK